MREAAFAHQIEYLLELHRWLWCHYEPAVRQSGRWATPLRGHKGAPDYMAVRDGRLIFVEIKGDRGRVSNEQAAWMCELMDAGIETHLWYPHDIEAAKEALR